MTHKVYYDSTNNKEVVDISGSKPSAQIETDHGLTPAKQVVTVQDTEATEVIDGTLQTFDIATRATANQTARDTEIAQKRTDLKNQMGWTDAQLDAILDLVKYY